jgi:chromosome segregation ATPase
MRGVALVLISTLVGCGSGDNTPGEFAASDSSSELRSRISELEASLEEARDQAQQAEAAAAEVERAISEVRSAANRFSYEDWQDVVPAMTTAINDAESHAHEVVEATSQTTHRLDR